jgi:micrococcal nuclease
MLAGRVSPEGPIAMRRTTSAPLRLLALILLGWASLAHADEFSGQVIAISDGDTLTVLRERTPVKLRLHGIDAPEAGQDFGAQAKAAAAELAFGKTVTVRHLGTDRYHRSVALVVLPDGRLLNHELVRSGFAWWFSTYAPADATLERLEAEARQAKRGLWSQPHPIPPWDWRHHTGLPSELATSVIGNRRSGVYHRPTCPNAARTSEKNRIIFRSEAAAAAAGYRPGKDCHED